MDFLTKVWTLSNDCLRAVKNDMERPECMIACRALGLVGKYLTGPWMRLVEQDVGILELNRYYQHAVDVLQKWSTDASGVVSGTAPAVFADVAVTDDLVFKELIRPTESDAQTRELVQQIFTNILGDCIRQLEDQLPGGKFSQLTPELQCQAESCVGNNISGERVFGQLDFQLKRAPSSTVTFSESKLMYVNNSTENWISAKDSHTKETLLNRARKEAVRSQKLDRERQWDVERQRQVHLESKRKEMEKKREDARDSREALLDDLNAHGGLWKSKDQMDCELRDKSRAQQVVALKTQINVRKKILLQNASNAFFSFSASKQPHPIEKLKANLLHLMEPSDSAGRTEIEEILLNPGSLCGRQITHLWIEENSEKWWDGRITEQIDHTNEFLVQYEKDSSDEQPINVYLELSEIVADMRSGDLKLL